MNQFEVKLWLNDESPRRDDSYPLKFNFNVTPYLPILSLLWIHSKCSLQCNGWFTVQFYSLTQGLQSRLQWIYMWVYMWVYM